MPHTKRVAGNDVSNELYLSQMPVVSWNRVWKGVAEAGTRAPNQLVIWETLMDAETLLLTGNTETVYALGAIDLKRDGPTVVEVPAGLLGGISVSGRARSWGSREGADQEKAGKFLLLPPTTTARRRGYLIANHRHRVVLGVWLRRRKADKAVALMKSKVYSGRRRIRLRWRS